MVEALLGAVIVIPLFLLAANLFLVVAAVTSNDDFCAECCRLASAGRAEVTGDFEARIKAVVFRSSRDHSENSLISYRLHSVDIKPGRNELNRQIEAVSITGGTVCGNVTVQTESQVKLIGISKPLTFVCRQTYPFTCHIANH
jgi:hypothetical protein